MSARQGFSLVEMVIVITIVGILAWLAFPSFDAFYEIRLDAAARRVAADLRYAQNQTIGKRVIHGVLFETALARYTVFAPTPTTPVVDPADRSRSLRVDFNTKTEFQGVSITSATFGTTPGVKYDFFGVPRDTAGVELAATGRVILTYQGASDTIDVTPQTGKVVVR